MSWDDGGMGAYPRDSVDLHVARWAEYWKDNPDYQPEVEGAITRMQNILKRHRRLQAAAFWTAAFC